MQSGWWLKNFKKSVDAVHQILNEASTPMCDISLFRTFLFADKRRFGAKEDGGYVVAMLDGDYDCYISAGVSNEESFSRDFISTFGMTKENAFAFDGTINDYPYNYTRDITFIRKNINSYNDGGNTDLYDLINRYNNVFLKMDIEGGEYPWLLANDYDTMKKLKQIVIECHAIVDATGVGTLNDIGHIGYDLKNKCFAKLAETHYLVHVHGNNHGPRKNGIPYTIELTYVNKKCFVNTPELNNIPLPLAGIDYPNASDKPDYVLDFQPFTWS
jgi:hypothetical protein